MEKALVNFSFDDGRLDNYTIALPILKKYGLVATYNITTGFVKGEMEKGEIFLADHMTPEMVRELYKNRHEIAGHGYFHKNTTVDIIAGVNGLNDIIGMEPGKKSLVRGFASPGTDMTIEDYQQVKGNLENHNIEYVRLSFRYLRNERLKVLARKLGRILHLPCLYSFAYADTLMGSAEFNENILYSIPILSQTSVAEIKALVNIAIKRHKACVLMFHSIEDKVFRDNWDFDVAKFEELCKWLRKKQDAGKLEVVTSAEVFDSLRKR